MREGVGKNIFLREPAYDRWHGNILQAIMEERSGSLEGKTA